MSLAGFFVADRYSNEDNKETCHCPNLHVKQCQSREFIDLFRQNEAAFVNLEDSAGEAEMLVAQNFNVE